jgi:hypothetical protein
VIIKTKIFAGIALWALIALFTAGFIHAKVPEPDPVAGKKDKGRRVFFVIGWQQVELDYLNDKLESKG